MIDNTREIYISVDIEASGPIPGEYSMLSLGACVVDDMGKSFYVELKPICHNCIPEALAVSNLDLKQLQKTGDDPAHAMNNFATWIAEVTEDGSPIFVGFNASFDWAFVNWYFYKFLNRNPFGIGGIDIKAFFMGLYGTTWNLTCSSLLPAEFQANSKHTHNALDDAQSQAQIFQKIHAASMRRAERYP